jgi:hypothetical protein
MKGGIAAHVMANMANGTKPERHRYVKGNGKPGQTFNVERLERACLEFRADPCEVAAKGLVPELTPTLTEKERSDIALKIMEYLMPKKRAIEGEIEHEHTFVVASEPMTDDEWSDTYGMGATTGSAEGIN